MYKIVRCINKFHIEILIEFVLECIKRIRVRMIEILWGITNVN